MTKIAAAVCGMLLLAGSSWAAPVNLVQNGSFSDGNVGFSTDYMFTPNLPSMDDLWEPGVFGLDSNAAERHPYWSTVGDHTGNGAFMLVNGVTHGPSTVWQQSIAVTPNTNYFFEAWAMDLCCNALMPEQYVPPTLEFWINGALLGANMTGGTGVWQGLSNLWYSANTSLAVLEVRNTSTAYDGNDFGIDDMYLGTETNLQPTPEPETWVLLGIGLTLLMVGKHMNHLGLRINRLGLSLRSGLYLK